jgi:hypothetical protein
LGPTPFDPVPVDSAADAIDAAVLRRLLAHLRLREDATNIELMGLAGFCRNCLAEWLEEASAAADRPLSREAARARVYGEPYADWKARQPEATAEQLSRMEASLALNARLRAQSMENA